MILALISAALLTDSSCLETGRRTVLVATIAGKVDRNPGGHAPFPYAAARLHKPVCIRDAQTGVQMTVDELTIEPSERLDQPLSMVGRTVKIEGTVVLERDNPQSPPGAAPS